MLTVNNNYNNVNFTARLDLTNIKTNKKVWQDVAQMFEQKTQKTPYTFELTEQGKQLDIYALPESKGFDDVEHECTFSEDGTKKLMSLTADKITQKLVKLLDVFKYQDKTRQMTGEFLKKLEKNDIYNTLDTSVSKDKYTISEKFWDSTFDKMTADRIAATKNDEIFEGALFID